MSSGQQFLFAPEKPLVKRLGKKFFRKIPRRAGVDKMRNAQGEIVSVGKAKDLRQRLRSYRVANPEHMARRHLRMVREVARIEFDLCPNETAALKHESKLIRSLKPRFNRAGVWPGKPKFLCWRVDGEQLEITVVETPATGWQRFGPLGGGATYLHRTMARLLWLAVNPERPLTELPTGWVRGEFMETTTIKCNGAVQEVAAAFESYFWEVPDRFVLWLGSKFTHRTIPFDRRVIETELETLKEFSAKKEPDKGGS